MKKHRNGKALTTSQRIGRVAKEMRTLPMKVRIELLAKANLISPEQAKQAIARLPDGTK